jgi:glucose-1-phosphate thymidylyltransferase
MQSFRFILPAAGIGARLSPSLYPKELLPIRYAVSGGQATPSLVIEHSIRAMHIAGVNTGAIVISPQKYEILRYLGDGSRFGVSLMYAVQSAPTGLPAALDRVIPWLGSYPVCLAMPDTIFLPNTAVADVADLMIRSDADLVLGVFPTRHPERFGPVEIAPNGKVLRVEEKPVAPKIFNTWGVAAWGPRFTQLLHSTVGAMSNAEQQDAAEMSLGHIFDLAVKQGLSVQAVYKENSEIFDLGTPEGLYQAIYFAD